MPVDQFPHHPLLPLGILLIAGYLVGRAANFVRLPRVTGYIVAGIMLSPSFTGILHRPQLESLQGFISTLALAVIAFAIGGSLEMASIRKLGKSILWITFIQAAGAMLAVSFVMYGAGYFFPALTAAGRGTFLSAILIVGAISAATAPAAVLAVVHELRARGPLTTTLLGVVALDDAVTLVLFSVSLSIAGGMLPLANADTGMWYALFEIGGALLCGGLAGLALPHLVSHRQRTEVNLVAVVGMVFLVGGLSIQAGFSPLLANMFLGFVVINRMEHANTLFHQMANIEEMLYCLFFALAGAHFDVTVLMTSSVLGLMLLLGRFLGKFCGTLLGARISKAPAVTGRYLGITLLPQAGLSLGLVLLARPYFTAGIYDILLNAMLASVIINEVISPPMVKWALEQAREIGFGEDHEDT